MERRLSPRVPVNLAGELVTNSVQDRVVSGTISHINHRGASLVLPINVHISSNSTLQIHLPAQKRKLHIPVLKVSGPRFRDAQNGNTAWIYGLQFRRLSKVHFYAISNALTHSSDESDRRKGQRRVVAGGGPGKRETERRRAILNYHCFIDGNPVETVSRSYYFKVEKLLTAPSECRAILSRLKQGKPPANLSDFVYGSCSHGNDDLYRRATDAAARALPAMQALSVSTRTRILRDIQRLLIEKKGDILELLKHEGHPGKLAEWEFEGMTQGLANETLSFYKNQIAFMPMSKDARRSVLLTRRADGVVGVSPPGNAACSNSLTACLALLGGNTLVIKPPKSQPISTLYLWREIIWKAVEMNGGPKGAVNIIVGPSVRILDNWLSDEKVKDIIFFGTSERGLEFGARAYALGKKPILELSGKDPLLVWKDADIEKAADSLIDAFLGSTQICMVPKMALVHDRIYDRFIADFLRKVQSVKPGLPTDDTTLLSPVLKIDEYFAFLQDAIKNGGKILAGGRRVDHLGIGSDKGQFVEPTVIEFDQLTDAARHSLVLQKENFFPLLPVIRISSLHKQINAADEDIFNNMVAFVNENAYGLRASVWTRSPKYIRQFARSISNCGLLMINRRHVGFCAYLATHGGTKKTGGPFGELSYMWQKTTHLQGLGIY